MNLKSKTTRNKTIMKKLTSISILGMMLTAASLQAQVDIKITGSTAFRASMFRAITNLYGANLQNENPGGPTANNSGANRVTYRGTIPTLFGANVVTIYTDMGGSIQGVHSLVLNDLQTFFSNPTNTATGPTGATNLFTGVADLGFSDVFQNATVYQTVPLRDLLVAIQPFALNKGVSAASLSISNITSQQLKTFLGNGAVPLSYFTGRTNDDTKTVYLPGRSEDSGTRLTMDLDCGFGPSGFENFVYDVTSAGTWFLSTNTPPGFSSGSGVLNALKNVNTTDGAIGYLGMNDSLSLNNGANVITYNGALPFRGIFTTALTTTNDYTPVIEGTYSYWSYEHLYERQSESTSGNVHKYRAALGTNIDVDIATIFPKIAVRLSEMRVSRQADGGPISP
jgi:hypothetical protein